MRRRVKRSSIVINNSDPTGESRSGYRERLVKQIRYIILLNEREARDRRATILGSERMEDDLRWMRAEVREIRVSSTTHETRSKLTSRDFALLYCTSMHPAKIASLRMQFLGENREVTI